MNNDYSTQEIQAIVDSVLRSARKQAQIIADLDKSHKSFLRRECGGNQTPFFRQFQEAKAQTPKALERGFAIAAWRELHKRAGQENSSGLAMAADILRMKIEAKVPQPMAFISDDLALD